jgi:HlyD family secretion protein
MSNNDATLYEVHIRINPAAYAHLSLNGNTSQVPFRSGMNARAEVITNKKEMVLSVPVSALTSRAHNSDSSLADLRQNKKKDEESDVQEVNDDLDEVVFLMGENGSAQKQVVQSGIRDMNYVEITTGLTQGQKVITAPSSVINKTMKTGMKVKVVPKEQLFDDE